jgi:protein-disulfide isomerase
MDSLFALSTQVRASRARHGAAGMLVSLAALCAAGAAASGQQAPTKLLDASLLHPPAGARVAIIEFQDLQCPVCSTTNPTVEAAAATYKIPLVRHDLLIPSHNWSRNAAINARWFDLKSKALGSEYRDQVYLNQRSITDPGVLSEFTVRFAKSHNIDPPQVVDPDGKLYAEVDADNALGVHAGIDHTPSIWIVTAGSKGAPYTEVLDPMTQLYTTIDQALKDTRAAGK